MLARHGVSDRACQVPVLWAQVRFTAAFTQSVRLTDTDKGKSTEVMEKHMVRNGGRRLKGTVHPKFKAPGLTLPAVDSVHPDNRT